MKVNDPNLAPVTSPEVNRSQQSQPTGPTTRLTISPSVASGSYDDVHLSELVRSLRSLASESPERQARLEQIARSYANGTYKVDPGATASKIVDDALES